MLPDDRNLGLLWDMLNAAHEIVELTKDVTYQQFESQRALRFAVERLIMIIGEAAKRVSDGYKDSHPEIPWKAMIGQRNVLAHEYGEILIERIWSVVVKRIPELIRLLKPLIKPEDDNQ
jgi:uncharacterized protein with HEPN domain